VQYVPPAEPMTLRWERTDGQPGVEPETITPPASPTWIYIATEAAPTEAHRVEEAVRAFLIAGLRPGFKVSLGGRAFTDDKTALLTTLSHLSRNPWAPTASQAWSTWRARWPMTRAMSARWLPRSGGRRKARRHWPAFTVRPERVEIGGSFAQPMITVGRAERSMPIYGDVALNQYFDLVEKMAALPGKKAIVLMRRAYGLEPDNVGMLLDLSSFAVRKRVSFYTVDSRRSRVAVARRGKVRAFHDRPAHTPNRAGSDRPARDGGAGARRAAEPCARNGGKMLIGTNKLSEIFDRVAQDASGYYVISYYRSTCARPAASAR
jgi:hypothetical protein